MADSDSRAREDIKLQSNNKENSSITSKIPHRLIKPQQEATAPWFLIPCCCMHPQLLSFIKANMMEQEGWHQEAQLQEGHS